jgi:hypothetical protein
MKVPPVRLSPNLLPVDHAVILRKPSRTQLVLRADAQSKNPMIKAILTGKVNHIRADQFPEAVQQEIGNIIGISMGQE